jgi:hypothetical protein
MKTYKVIISMAAFLVGVVGMQPAAQAMLTGITAGANYATEMDPVSFYLYDLDGNDRATLSADTISASAAAKQPSLHYSLDGTKFDAFSSHATIEFGGEDFVPIFFRLAPTNGGHEVDAGRVTFQNYDLTNSNAIGHDLFQALYIEWDRSPFTITISSADDPSSPSVPIPASVILLFTGLAGLIGFRRRLTNR